MTTPPSGSSHSAALRVLLAEDTPLQEKLAVHLLEDEGHSVSVAHNGKEAVEAMEDDRFDLVLMDVQMPVMDGLEAASVLRQTIADMLGL